MMHARALQCATCVLAALLNSVLVADDIADRARRLHFSSLVVDTHTDTTRRLMDGDFDISVRQPDGSIDIPRLKNGGVGALFFSISVPKNVSGPEAVKRAIDEIDAVDSAIGSHSTDMVLATSAEQVRSAHAQHKIAALIGIEGGEMIANDLSILRAYASLGVRYMTLAHSVNNDWADSSTDNPMHNGLSDFGKQVVREMNRVGVMVDIAHVSDKTFYDALAVSQAPIITSHSSCRTITNSPRNLSDDMIRALAVKGGVIQIDFHVGMLSQEFRDAAHRNPELLTQIDSEAEVRCGNKLGCRDVENERLTRKYVTEGKLPRVEWIKIVDHIDHAVKVAGIDHVGLGSDFDGGNMPYGMEDASQLPKITEALLRRGYTEEGIRKILGGNVLRVMEQVEQVSRSLQSRP
jgi:membrane dipeptidase